MRRFISSLLCVSGVGLLAGCTATPLAPTINASPGPGKAFSVYQDDDTACRAAAAKSVAGEADAANQQAFSSTLAAQAAGASGGDSAQAGANVSQSAQSQIQNQYNQTYGNCMHAAGDNVDGWPPIDEAPPPEEPSRPVVMGDPLVRKIQQQLIQLHYLHGYADGVAGPMTTAAIRKFETDKSMTVDGAPSRNLLETLQSTSGAPSAAAAPPAGGGSSGNFALPPPAH